MRSDNKKFTAVMLIAAVLFALIPITGGFASTINDVFDATGAANPTQSANPEESTSPANPHSGEIDILYGDIDHDEKVTSADARLALRASVELEDYAEDSPEFAAADIDQSGKITAADARQILRLAVGLDIDLGE